MTIKCRDCDTEASDFFEFNSIKNVLPMTGTPILNKPQDLFAQLSLIDPVNFTSERNFLDAYCQQDWYTKKWKFRPGGLERLTNQMASKFVMRDRKSAGITIPPQEIQYYDLVLDPDEYPNQFAVLQTLNKHAAILLDENKVVSVLAMIALITRKRQAIVYPDGIQLKNQDGEVVYTVNCNESIKIDKVIKFTNGDRNEYEGLIPELIGTYDEDNISSGTGYDGERVVLFSQFKEPLKEIERRCKEANIPVARYDGDTPDHIREQIQEDFDAKHCDRPGYVKKFQVVLCNYKTGGVGLNFTGASQMIILDEEWSPGKADQAMGRIDRMGQTKETTVHVLRVRNSIDTWMAQLNADKAAMVEGFESEIDLQQSLRDAIEGGML